jgi:hypothetical protein
MLMCLHCDYEREENRIKIPLTFCARDFWAARALSPSNLHFSSRIKRGGGGRQSKGKLKTALSSIVWERAEEYNNFLLNGKSFLCCGGLFPTRCRAPSDAQALYFILNEEKISINFIRPWLKAAVAAKNGSQVHNSPHSWDSLGCLIMIVSSLVDEATWTSPRACMRRVASRI